MTNLSELLPSGGGAKEFTATASGAISQGQTVALQSDGTVKAIASSPSALGTEGVLVNSLNPGSTYNDNINVTYCSGSDRYVVTYRNGDNNFYWTSRVCQANGTQLTVGSASVIQSYGANNDTIYYDSSADRVVHVSSSGSGISLRVGEINASANSITWGTSNTLYSGSWKFRGSCFDTSVNIGFFQANHPTNQYLYGYMVSVNAGTNFASFDYEDNIAYNASNGDYGGDCTFDSNYNIVIGCYNLSNGSAGLEAQPFKLINNNSGKSFTKGSTLAVVPSSSGFYWGKVSIHWDATAQAAIVLAEKSSGSNQGAYTWTIITNSTTSLSRDPNNNTGVELAGNSTSKYYYPYHITSDGKNGFIAMSRWQNNDGVYVEGSIQAGPTSPTWTTPTSGNLTGTKNLYYGEVAYNTTDQKFLFVYNTDFADTDYRTFNYVTSNRDDFVGIASQAISNAASGKINPQGGVATTQLPLSAVYNNQNFSLSGQSIVTPEEIRFKPDGTKFYILSGTDDTIYQYSMSTAWDISTASYESKSFSVSSQEGSPQGLAINADGTSFYVCGQTKSIYQYNLSTAYDISTASYANKSFSFSTQLGSNNPWSIDFNDTGTILYMISTVGVIYQYTLSTAFDIATASYASKSFDTSSQTSDSTGIAITSDGTSLYVVSSASDQVFKYTLSTAFDLATASYSGFSFTTTAQDNFPYGVAVKTDETQLYVTGSQNDSVYQYSLSTALTPNTVYYVQMDGTLTTTSSTVTAGKAISTTQLILNGAS